MRLVTLIALASSSLSCAGPRATEPTTSVTKAPPAAPRAVDPAPSPTHTAELTPAPASAADGIRCGDLECRSFDEAVEAFDFVLARSPRVLGVGETHAPRGSVVTSATARFAEQLLPRLAGRASDLIVELWVAAGNCGSAEREVAERQKPVTQSQATTNQDEFIALGHRAKALGIRPHALVPTCEQYRRILGAGAGDIDAMLQMLAETTARDVGRLLQEQERRRAPAMVIAYGGAVHNDLAPRAGREHWSFGPALRERTRGAYVELDLIVPEFIGETEAWSSLPWYAAYRATELQDPTRARLYAVAPNAFVLIFPRSTPAPETTGR